MAQHDENRPIDDAVELLKTNGFDGLADAVTVFLNSAMVAEQHVSLAVRRDEERKEAQSASKSPS